MAVGSAHIHLFILFLRQVLQIWSDVHAQPCQVQHVSSSVSGCLYRTLAEEVAGGLFAPQRQRGLPCDGGREYMLFGSCWCVC